MYNTIILKRGEAKLSESEYKRFQKGDTIFGDNSEPEEIQRWVIEDDGEAKKELAKRKCSYTCGFAWDIEEYALEYCECDEDGDFIQGSDYELAREA